MDGFRGLALLGMLAWHAELLWVKGGFARMTIFFVLSGFLGASSYERIRGRESRGAFRRFWVRRARRLLPLTVIGVLWAIVVTALVGSPQATRNVVGDSISVLFSFSNWRFIREDVSYGALFDAPSAFQHYWSLSLEEQAFLLLPGLLAATSLLAGALRRGSAWILTAIAVVLIGLPYVFEQSPDTVYYGTHVRFGEFVAGVALAIAVRRRDPKTLPESTQRAMRAAGTASLAVLVAAMILVDRNQGWLYRGGIGVFALPAVGVLAAITVGGRVVTAVLGFAPLALAGRWAFSIYVLHWPLYLLMADGRVPLSGEQLAAAQITASIAIGGLVFRFVERPLIDARFAPTDTDDAASGRLARVRRLWADNRSAFPLLGGGVAVCIVASLLVPSTAPLVDLADGDDSQVTAMSREEAFRILAERDLVGLPRDRDTNLVGVSMFGGSTALRLGLGTRAWSDHHAGVEDVPGFATQGCGLLTQGDNRDDLTTAFDTSINRPEEVCLDWEHRWSATAVLRRTDVALIVPSRWDLIEWRMDGDDEWRAVGDPAIDELLLSLLELAATNLRQVGVGDVVLVTPILAPDEIVDPVYRERALRYGDLVRQVAAASPERSVIDLSGWTDSLPPSEFERLFPDDIHPSEESAGEIWTRFLGPELEREIDRIPVER